MNTQNLSVIISCFNEEDVIVGCLQRIRATVPQAEIVVVHGGKDKTAELAREFGKNDPNVVVIVNHNDRGKGHAIKVGLKKARHDLMMQFDADMQFVPEEIPKVIQPIVDGKADVSFGCRFMKESNVDNYKFSFFRVVGNMIVNRYISFLAGQRFYDITTGYKAWTRRAITAINFKDDKFVYEAEIAIRAARKGFRVAMVPITYHNRLGGISGHGAGFKEVMSINITGLKILWFSTLIRLGLW